MSHKPDTKLARRVDKLDEGLNKLLMTLREAEPRATSRAPVVDAWTPLQALHHLCLAERGSVDYLLYKLGNETPSPVVGAKHWMRGKLISLALASPFKFSAPKQMDSRAIAPASDLSLADLEHKMRSTRADLRQLLTNMPPEWAKQAVFKHAIAGRISVSDMLLFFATHQRRHTKQIERGLAQNASYYRRQKAR